MIRPFIPKQSAIAAVKLGYLEWERDKPPEKRIRFEDDLTEYLCHGFVVSRPDLFWMGKIVDLAPEGYEPDIGWFIRVAVGNLRELFESLPVFLPKMAWCRAIDPKKVPTLRIYDTKRIAQLIYRNEKLEGAE